MNSFYKGIILGVMITGCGGASLSFAWKHYGLRVATYDGKLLGVTEADDKDFKTCENNNCVLMYTADFFAFKQDYLSTKDKLIACEKNLP